MKRGAWRQEDEATTNGGREATEDLGEESVSEDKTMGWKGH
jgi:hypothetical protein|tara:strand:+ start:103 stop:225 length:123 start_codon:yes stop_codon:yes gene_type:complete